MNLLNLIGFKGSIATQSPGEVPEIYTFTHPIQKFVDTDLTTIYLRILTEVVARTQNIKEEIEPLVWDNCLGSESQDGLLTMLSKAMVNKSELYLVYIPALKLVRKATNPEQSKIQADYKAKGESQDGVYVTFKNYDKTDMLKIYSELEYYSVGSLWKGSKLSTAIQLKMNDLRASVGAIDSEPVIAQALAIAEALKCGKDVLIDGKDTIETAKPDLTATNSMNELIAQKRSFYLGLPAAWITGLANKGMGDSGDAEMKAVERGLKPYFKSIIKPVFDRLFDMTAEYESEDTAVLSVNLEMLKVFDITSDDYLSKESKLKMTNKYFKLPDGTKGDPPAKVVPAVTPPALASKPVP